MGCRPIRGTDNHWHGNDLHRRLSAWRSGRRGDHSGRRSRTGRDSHRGSGRHGKRHSARAHVGNGSSSGVSALWEILSAMLAGTHDVAVFILAGLLLNITPGADTLYIVARSTTQGSRSGAFAALGIGAGCFVHCFGAALGLSALLAASATAFTVL